MPNKELIEKCLLPDREFNKLHFNCLTPAEVVKSCDKLNYAQLMFAIPIIAEEIKKGLERKVRNWEATTFNDECDGKPPYSMTTLEVRTSWWQSFWGEYLK